VFYPNSATDTFTAFNPSAIPVTHPFAQTDCNLSNIVVLELVIGNHLVLSCLVMPSAEALSRGKNIPLYSMFFLKRVVEDARFRQVAYCQCLTGQN